MPLRRRLTVDPDRNSLVLELFLEMGRVILRREAEKATLRRQNVELDIRNAELAEDLANSLDRNAELEYQLRHTLQLLREAYRDRGE
jgi:hypothetical protein